MKLKKQLLLQLASIMMLLLIFAATSVQAVPRGTPTVVTNDATSPVVVTGNINSTCQSSNYPWKAIGVTVQKKDANSSVYARSAACAAEYPGSRICSTEEMILAPGRVSIIQAAWVMPTFVGTTGGLLIDISRRVVGTNYINPCIIDNDVQMNCIPGPNTVVCCAP